jgi:septal ring factor EnvC (AmiA/AmiB activator)
MNEKIYRVLFFVTLVFALLFAGAGIYLSYRNTVTERELGNARAELERLRTELDNATNKQSAITSDLERIAEISSDTERVLSEAVTSVQGLREQIHAIRTQFEKMETCLRNYRSSNSTRNCDTGNNSSE